MRLISYLSRETYVLGAQKNRLGETVLLSTHNIYFGLILRKIINNNALLSARTLLRDKSNAIEKPTKGTVAILYCLRDIFVPERHRLAIPNTASHTMFEVY